MAKQKIINDSINKLEKLIENVIEEKDEKKVSKRGRKKLTPEEKEKKLEQKKNNHTDEEESNDDKKEVVLKKRGRKPKKKDFEYIEVKPVQFTDTDETLILHIPLNIKKYEETVKENNPVPYDQFTSNYCYLADENNIKSMTDKYTNNSVEYLLQQFKDAKKKDEYPIQTNYYCWWCCHPFKTVPIGIPIKYNTNKKFDTHGCFCSFNCASAYNIQHSGALVSERNSLLHMMCRQLCDLPYCEIKNAPPKEYLHMFGGFMSIDEYRKNNITYEYSFKTIIPPLVSIIPQVEITTSTANKSNNTSCSYLPVNERRIKTAQDNQKIKINSFLNNSKNTIESFMNLK